MKVKLLHDTRVNFPAGTELEVSEAEASRLQAFGLAEEIKQAPKKVPKKTAK